MNRTLVIVAQDAEQVRTEQLQRLQRLQLEGFEVQVATPYGPALDELAGLGFDTRPLPGADRWNLPGRAAAYPILQGEWLTNPPLLVHGFESSWAYITALAGHQARVPAVFVTKSCHDTDQPFRRRAYRQLGHWATNYIVHHEDHLRDLTGLVPTSKLDLLLGGRGVDLESFDPDDEDLQPVPRPDARIVVASRSTPAVEQVRRYIATQNPGVSWLLYDDEPTAALLGSADVLLQTDALDYDGFQLMAAAAMRLASVAADSVAARTVISDHETGRIAPNDGLARVLLDVVGNPKRLQDMGIRARARAERRFDRRQIDEQLLTIYDRALSELAR